MANGRGGQKKASNDIFEWKVKMVNILNIVTNHVQRKKEGKQIHVDSSFYYRIWIYTSQYFKVLTSVQPTCTVPLCNFYNFSFVLLQCRLLALYLEDEQNINCLSRNILGTNL
jgi:hypothetical protein